jgi:hypothetical protein
MPAKPPRKLDGSLDIKVIERPKVIRDREHRMAHSEGSAALDMDYLDVPAFLRHQAD